MQHCRARRARDCRFTGRFSVQHRDCRLDRHSHAVDDKFTAYGDGEVQQHRGLWRILIQQDGDAIASAMMREMAIAALRYACNTNVLNKEMLSIAAIELEGRDEKKLTGEQFEAFEFILSIGGDINASDPATGNTVLHELVYQSHPRVLSKLIMQELSGADWLIRNKGVTFVQHAVVQLAVVQLAGHNQF